MSRAERLETGVSPFAVIEVDSELRVVDWDTRAEREFGVSRVDAHGQAIAALIPVPGDEAAWRGLVDGDDVPRVWRLSRTGEARVFEWRRQQLVDADGAVRGAICFGCDVTIRTGVEQQRALDSQLIAAICEHVNVALWATDDKGVFLYQDGRASGVPARTLVGMNVFDLPSDEGGAADMRAALAGATKHNTKEQHGKIWESWLLGVPERHIGEAALIGISLDVSDLKRGEHELREKLETIERQQQAIRAMSTPIIEVWDGVLTLPILGLVDSVRTAEIMDSVLQAITRVRARFAILDLTGVEVVDASTAGHLLGLIRAIRLLGAEGIITGIHPNIAQTMVTHEFDLSKIVVHANLREALKYCIGRVKAR